MNMEELTGFGKGVFPLYLRRQVQVQLQDLLEKPEGRVRLQRVCLARDLGPWRPRDGAGGGREARVANRARADQAGEGGETSGGSTEVLRGLRLRGRRERAHQGGRLSHPAQPLCSRTLEAMV